MTHLTSFPPGSGDGGGRRLVGQRPAAGWTVAEGVGDVAVLVLVFALVLVLVLVFVLVLLLLLLVLVVVVMVAAMLAPPAVFGR